MTLTMWLARFLARSRVFRGRSWPIACQHGRFHLETLPDRDSPSILDSSEMAGSFVLSPETRLPPLPDSWQSDCSPVAHGSLSSASLSIDFGIPVGTHGSRPGHDDFIRESHDALQPIVVDGKLTKPENGFARLIELRSEGVNSLVTQPVTTYSTPGITFESTPSVVLNNPTGTLILTPPVRAKQHAVETTDRAASATAVTVVVSPPAIVIAPIVVAPPVLVDPRTGSTSDSGQNFPSAVPPAPSVPPSSPDQPAATFDVSPLPIVSRSPVQPSTPVFQISVGATAREAQEIAYTLTAHDSVGSVSIRDSVAVSHSAPAVIAPGSLLVGRSPDLLTVTLRDAPIARQARTTATQFLSPVPQIGDSTLFEAHRVARSEDAFGALVRRHEGMVMQISRKIVGNRADAQDVGQFVFLELSRFPSKFSGALVAWLRTVSRNTSLAFLRAKRRRSRHELESSRPAAMEPALPLGLDDELEAALQQLPAELGQAVRLRYLDGYSQHEAARIVGCPRGTLSRRAAIGVQALRSLLTQEI